MKQNEDTRVEQGAYIEFKLIISLIEDLKNEKKFYETDFAKSGIEFA